MKRNFPNLNICVKGSRHLKTANHKKLLPVTAYLDHTPSCHAANQLTRCFCINFKIDIKIEIHEIQDACQTCL
jgi:hypothetical protein